MTYLIQGVFFYGVSTKGFEGTVMRSMFSGVIETNQEGILAGKMKDEFGESRLSDISIDGDRFTFTKIYHGHNNAPISYEFLKGANGIWCGKFDGEKSGTGQANCILTAVPDNFLKLS